jgi:hypothetical protein
MGTVSFPGAKPLRRHAALDLWQDSDAALAREYLAFKAPQTVWRTRCSGNLDGLVAQPFSSLGESAHLAFGVISVQSIAELHVNFTSITMKSKR